MSMMVNRVSNVSFKANNAEEILSRPGAYAKPAPAPAGEQNNNNPQVKKHSAAKIILRTLATAAVVAFALFAAHKWAPETFNAAKKFEDIKNLEGTGEKVKEYVTTTIAKGGKAIEDAGIKVAEGCKNLWNKMFNNKVTEDLVDEAAGAAGGAAS